jgi:hypothetical protein
MKKDRNYVFPLFISRKLILIKQKFKTFRRIFFRII